MDKIINFKGEDHMNSVTSDRRAALPTLFFDSGLGGLSVLRHARRIMPAENYIFFGDSANAPYGTKSADQIRALTLEHVSVLYAEGIKAIVIACNTATSAAIRPLRDIYTDIPVVGIEPALKPAATMSEHPTVIVLATPLTVRAEKFHDLLGHYADRADVIPLGCPGLMEFVEKGDLDGEDVRAYLHGLLSPYLGRHIDAIVLGCTHYPFLRSLVQEIVGPDIQIFDGGEGTARELHRRLAQSGLLLPESRRLDALRASHPDLPAEALLDLCGAARGTVDYRESLPEKLPLCRKLMGLPF